MSAEAVVRSARLLRSTASLRGWRQDRFAGCRDADDTWRSRSVLVADISTVHAIIANNFHTIAVRMHGYSIHQYDICSPAHVIVIANLPRMFGAKPGGALATRQPFRAEQSAGI